ncbi:uncharacterized protein LOC142327092 [Lycorma delicatula]|uniref:uncharacterized protein LOC142327092 n=1 Tax=Lycorma delicatula TaxID=130591 RepID=UPI003F51296C
MAGRVWILFLLAISLPDKISSITNINKTENSAESRITSPTVSSIIISVPYDKNQHQCSYRIESTINSMSTRRSSSGHYSSLDLSGYALHQPLRSAPYEMYVTDMRVKIPGRTSNNWARVEQCRFDPTMSTLQSRLIFRDIAVTGAVKLYDENAPLKNPLRPSTMTDKCKMTIRLRRAGVGFTTVPRRARTGAVAVSTTATFIEPQFVSVHAYGCDLPSSVYQRTDGPEARDRDDSDISQEMEEVFLKGIRTLITNYMEKEMEQALRDTLMINLGYSVSYGKR